MKCLSPSDSKRYNVQKPEAASLRAGNIHLAAFHCVSCQVPRSSHAKLLLIQNWKSHSLCLNNLSFSVRSHSVGQNSFLGVYLMINYIKKLNRNTISNVDSIPHTHEIFNENQEQGSWICIQRTCVTWIFSEYKCKLGFFLKNTNIFPCKYSRAVSCSDCSDRETSFSHFLLQLMLPRTGYPEVFREPRDSPNTNTAADAWAQPKWVESEAWMAKEPLLSMDEWTLSNEKDGGSAKGKYRQLKELFTMEEFRVLLWAPLAL